MFPIITNIDQVLPAIQDCEEFYVAERDGHKIINYAVNFKDTFPPLQDENAAIRRECRGIIFDSETGNIIRRPYHKFFNVNERSETSSENINLSEDHVILDKLDGSMIAPFFSNERLIWGTKMGDTDVAKQVANFIATSENGKNYLDFVYMMLQYGNTPIFEWCSRKQKIVIDHPEDTLVLTAIRNLYTGNYYNLSFLQNEGNNYNIPVVKSYSPRIDMNEFIEHTRCLTDTEGYVVRFDDGTMVKLKCDWYVSIHKAKDSILWDRNIVQMIFDNTIDDVKPHLPEDERTRLIEFETNISNAIKEHSNIIFEMVYNYTIVERLSRKDFALHHKDIIEPFYVPIIFRLWDDNSLKNAESLVISTVKNHLSSNSRYDELNQSIFKGIVYNERY